MTKRKKKTLAERQKELIVESNELTVIGLRLRSAMLHAAMQLEAHREPQRYVR